MKKKGKNNAEGEEAGTTYELRIHRGGKSADIISSGDPFADINEEEREETSQSTKRGGCLPWPPFLRSLPLLPKVLGQKRRASGGGCIIVGLSISFPSHQSRGRGGRGRRHRTNRGCFVPMMELLSPHQRLNRGGRRKGHPRNLGFLIGLDDPFVLPQKENNRRGRGSARCLRRR